MKDYLLSSGQLPDVALCAPESMKEVFLNMACEGGKRQSTLDGLQHVLGIIIHTATARQ